MKNFKSFFLTVVGVFIIIISALTFVACSQDDDFKECIDNKKDSELEKMTLYLAENYGFSISDIKVEDSVLVAENDIVFDINDFWGKYSIAPSTRAHYRKNNIVSPSYRTIHISTSSDYSIPNEWLYAILNAMSAWNSLNGDIQFTLGSGYTATILIGYLYMEDTSVVARANFPSSTTGKPGSALAINNNFSGTLTDNQRTQVMIHELGHCIGLMHTDVIGDVLLNTGDQNSTDPNSVMQPYVLSNPVSPFFTQYDIAAYNLLYP